MNTNRNRTLIFVIVGVVIGLAVGIVIAVVAVVSYNAAQIKAVNSFDDCARAGFQVQETYPARCVLPDGRSFTEEVEEVVIPDNGDSGEFYGSSTKASCSATSECKVGGCNSEICGGSDVDGIASICLAPSGPTPSQAGYSCSCKESKCQWSK